MKKPDTHTGRFPGRNAGKEPDECLTEFRDSDLAELFRAQAEQHSGSPSEALDANILAAARAAIVDTGNKTGTGNGTYGADATDSTTTRQPPALPQQRSPGYRWFAMAATIVIGIAVAPRLLQSPDSGLSNRGMGLVDEPEEDKPVILETRQQVAVPADTITSETAPSAAAAPFHLVAPSAAPVITAIRSKRVTEHAVHIANDSQVLEDYRDTPEQWIQRIELLLRSGHRDEAMREYRLFREQYPAYQPDFVIRPRQ